jgi:malonyl CoA-acyl carrier protein transacylase
MTVEILEVNLPRAMRRRFERMELESLRAIAAELQERVDSAERRAYDAERASDCWQHLAQRLEEEMPSHLAVGLTQDGAVLVIEKAV